MVRPPTDDDLRNRLADRIAVDHTVLVRAKEAILHVVLRDHITEGDRLVNAVMKRLGAIDPGTLYLDRSIDFDAAQQLSPHAEFYSAKLAVCEAIWQLLHGGLLIPGNVSPVLWTPSVDIEPPTGQGGNSYSVPLDAFAVSFPHTVLPAPSLRTRPSRSLTDGDLFLREIAVTGLDPLVEDSLRLAVTCFRTEL